MVESKKEQQPNMASWIHAMKDKDTAIALTRQMLPSEGYDGEGIYQVHMGTQAPVMSSPQAVRLELMLHKVPSPLFLRHTPIKIGDRTPDFEFTDNHGQVVNTANFRGQPVVFRFTRAASTTFI